MISCLNYHWNLRTVGGSGDVVGPASAVQHAAVARLGCAADALCCLNPGELGKQDWKADVERSRVSYEGEELSVASGLSLDRCGHTLPPTGVCGSIDIVPLLVAETQRSILNPSTVRLPEFQVDGSWATPRVRMEPGHRSKDLLVDLVG